MFGIRTRQMAAVLVASLASPLALMAQWNAASNCNCYTPQQYVAAPAPVVTTACQCLQPVTQMVQQQVKVTAYRPKQTVEKRPVQRLRTVAREVTAYRQEMEARTVEVPVMTTQTVTEMRQQTINKGRWQTFVQPIPKMAACQYDNRPGMIGSMNRMGYSVRSAVQPNSVTHRQFIPQVCQCTVPVQKQVAVQTMRKVTYNVPKTVAYKTTQQVAEWYTDQENVTVTTMEPYTTTQTVSVPTTRMAYVDPYTGMAIAPQATQTAREKEPTRAADNNSPPSGEVHKGISYPKPAAQAPSRDSRVIRNESSPATPVRTVVQPNSRGASPSVASTGAGGWKAHTPSAQEIPALKAAHNRNSVVSK